MERGRLLGIACCSVAAEELASREVAQRQAKAAAGRVRAAVEAVHVPCFGRERHHALGHLLLSGAVLGANALRAPACRRSASARWRRERWSSG